MPCTPSTFVRASWLVDLPALRSSSGILLMPLETSMSKMGCYRTKTTLSSLQPLTAAMSGQSLLVPLDWTEECNRPRGLSPCQNTLEQTCAGRLPPEFAAALNGNQPPPTVPLIKSAKARGLGVHSFTFRNEVIITACKDCKRVFWHEGLVIIKEC